MVIIRVRRLTGEEVREFSSQELVDKFEVSSRRAFDSELTVRDQDEEGKNLNLLRTEILRRIDT